MSDYTLILGDCLDKMSQIQDGSVDMILADLPYGTTACKWDVVIPLELLWKYYKRVIKRNGAVVLFGSEPFSSLLIISNPKWFKYKWYWKKERGTGFAISSKRPLNIIEDIVIFYKSGCTYNPQRKKLDKPYRHVLPRNNSLSGAKSTLTSIRNPEGKIYKTYEYDTPNTLLEFARDNGCKTPHDTQKPVALLSYLIRTYTNEGETVLDNTCGSGSTLEAAMRTKRRSIGIEKDEGYFAIASERLERVAAELRGELNHLPMFAGASL